MLSQSSDKYENYLSTTMTARVNGIIPKEFISFLENCNLIYKDNKSLKLSKKAVKLGGTYRVTENGKWIIWPKNALKSFINKFKDKQYQQTLNVLNEYGVNCIYHMTHIKNIKSIFNNGLFPFGNKFQRKDISDLDVNRRRNKKEPIFKKSVHDYVPFYINPKNAMLYVRRYMQDEIVILKINRNIILNKNIVFTDGNASCSNTKFYNSIDDLKKLDWDCINDYNWYSHIDGKRTKMSEVLIPDYVCVDMIEGIICNNTKTQAKLEKIIPNFKINLDSKNKFYF